MEFKVAQGAVGHQQRQVRIARRVPRQRLALVAVDFRQSGRVDQHDSVRSRPRNFIPRGRGAPFGIGAEEILPGQDVEQGRLAAGDRSEGHDLELLALELVLEFVARAMDGLTYSGRLCRVLGERLALCQSGRELCFLLGAGHLARGARLARAASALGSGVGGEHPSHPSGKAQENESHGRHDAQIDVAPNRAEGGGPFIVGNHLRQEGDEQIARAPCRHEEKEQA